MTQHRHKDVDGKGIDAGHSTNKGILKLLLKLVFLVSNGNFPKNLTEAQTKQWIKDNI